MDKHESCAVIDAAGGDAKFAKLLGIDSQGFAQRVNNWRRRGIPSDVVLANFDVIRRLQSAASARPQSRTRKSSGRRAI